MVISARRWRRPTVAAGALVGAMLGGCCNVEQIVSGLAGDGAIDCGYAELGEDRTPVHDCMMAAQERGDAFFGGWRSIGRDTEVRYYRARDAEGTTWALGYDGGLMGQRPRLVGAPCVGPLERVAFGPPVGDQLDCFSGATTTTFCD